MTRTRSDQTILKTVLISDLAASTALLDTRGTDSWIQHLDGHTRAVSAVARRDGGHVTTFLDGFMVLFDSPSRAIAAALRLQNASAVLGLDGVRVGLDHGPMAQYRSSWWVGRPAHVAARLTDRCAPGELLISDACWSAAAEGLPLPRDERHTVRLRGLCEPTVAHTVRPEVRT